MIRSVDHVDVNERVHDDAGWSARYLFMTTMSAGIAVLGLLLSSPAVVIGAMLISPLMGPIIGLGFALATVDAKQIRRALFALLAGSALAVLFCAAIVLLSPLKNLTAELAARTRPNLFDLLVALFSALAGSYATIRGRAGTIVGVAIATALMPPLATVGFGLATLNGPVFGGALLLFVTNFVTIALTAAVMARLYSFGPKLSPNQTAMQLTVVIVTLAALAIPLGLSLRQLAWEGRAGSTSRRAIEQLFPSQARVSQLDLDFARDPIRVSAVVLTPRYRGDAEQQARTALQSSLDRQVDVRIQQYRVGTDASDAGAAVIQAAQARATPSSIESEAEATAREVAAIMGVGRDSLMVDDAARRIRTPAAPLPGATLATYRALEARAAASGWTVELVPPPVAPPTVAFVGEAFDQGAVDTAAWGAARLGYGISISGSTAQVGLLSAALGERGVVTTRGPGTGPVGGAALSWTTTATPS
ncbi:DUF389 domain-containing protein [Sphingomonas jejuensis]